MQPPRAEVRGKGAHLIILFQQMCERLAARSQQWAGNKKRLGGEQGDRSTRFQHPGGDGIKLQATE